MYSTRQEVRQHPGTSARSRLLRRTSYRHSSPTSGLTLKHVPHLLPQATPIASHFFEGGGKQSRSFWGKTKNKLGGAEAMRIAYVMLLRIIVEWSMAVKSVKNHDVRICLSSPRYEVKYDRRPESVKEVGNTVILRVYYFTYFWIRNRNWSHIAAHLLVLVGATSSNKSKTPSFQVGSGWNLVAMFFKYCKCASK